jgi:hypothetical protein
LEKLIDLLEDILGRFLRDKGSQEFKPLICFEEVENLPEMKSLFPAATTVSPSGVCNSLKKETMLLEALSYGDGGLEPEALSYARDGQIKILPQAYHVLIFIHTKAMDA